MNAPGKDIIAAPPESISVLYAIRENESQAAVPSQFTLAAAGAEGNVALLLVGFAAMVFIGAGIYVSPWWWAAFAASLIIWAAVGHSAARARRDMRAMAAAGSGQS